MASVMDSVKYTCKYENPEDEQIRLRSEIY